MSRERQKGTHWETQIVNYLADQFPDHNIRRTGSADYGAGDIVGISPELVIEAKNVQRYQLAAWVDQAETAAERNNAELAVVWMKRSGRTSPGGGYVVMSGDTFTSILQRLYAGAS